MKLTTRSHYSVKALLDLALQTKDEPVSVNSIAKRQDLPAPYLEKLLIQMRQAGIVKSIRGAHGGYQLAGRPEDISLGAIFEAVGENTEPFSRLSLDQQDMPEDWVTLTLWKRLHEKLEFALYGITLADLYYDARSRQASTGEENNFVV